MKLLELKMSNTTNITLNVDKLVNFFQNVTDKTKCTIEMSSGDPLTVIHSYDEVKYMVEIVANESISSYIFLPLPK